MKTIQVFKAQQTLKERPIESVTILIEEESPQFSEVASYKHNFEQEAEKLADALINTLPGGTLDRLLVKLLQHKATSFNVPL